MNLIGGDTAGGNKSDTTHNQYRDIKNYIKKKLHYQDSMGVGIQRHAGFASSTLGAPVEQTLESLKVPLGDVAPKNTWYGVMQYSRI